MSDGRDPHNFGPDDQPIMMPRKLGCELLERMEMARDVVESQTGREDTWARRVIRELTLLLERGDG